MKKSLLASAGAFAFSLSILAAPSARALDREAPVFRLQPVRRLADGYVGRSGDPRPLLAEMDRPLALAAADLDEDGVPDLIVGYGSGVRGFVAIHRGNIASIWAPPREAGVATAIPPFLSPARIFDLPVEPSFLETGDFDGDGHWDLVAAKRGDNGLYLIAGDGAGTFAPARRIAVAGDVTALLAGDVNRRDGLTDLLVGIDNGAGPAVLVFEGPSGALRAEPEVLALPTAPSSFAVGYLDAEIPVDFAVAAGNDVWIVSGRDRRPSLGSARRAAVGVARVEGLSFPTRVSGIAVGDFVPEPGAYREELAVLDAYGTVHLMERDRSGSPGPRWRPLGTRLAAAHAAESPANAPALLRARVSGAGEDLIVLDRGQRSLALYSAGPRNESGGEVELLGGRAVDLGVTPLAAVGMRLNGDALADLVFLSAEWTDPAVVETAVVATFTVTNANNSGTGSFRSAVQNANANAGADLIDFNIAGTGPFVDNLLATIPTITSPVTIDGYTQPGCQPNSVPLPGTSDAVLSFVIDGTGTSNADGLTFAAGSSVLRGLVINDFDVDGVRVISDGNIFEGNYIGPFADGITIQDNDLNGIQLIDAAGNTLGGTTPAARNLFSGNVDDGVDIRNPGSVGNFIIGNFIGANAPGNDGLGNDSDGIQIMDSDNNTVGGTLAGARNIIVDNLDDGMDISGEGTLIQGNYVGVLPDGLTPAANGGRGMQMSDSFQTIGGTTSAAMNLVSANFAGGILITGSGSTGNLIQGNRIGTDASGTAGLQNGSAGVALYTGGNTVGGVAPGTGNLISGNFGRGVLINLSTAIDNDVQGNLIGTDVTGTLPLGNFLDGVAISGLASANHIGGTDFGAGNVIACNGDDGIEIVAPGTSGNFVEANVIGLNLSGAPELGNTYDGVFIFQATDNTVGGLNGAATNYVLGNGGNGLVVQTNAAVGNRLLGNVLLNNALLGIDLGRDGITLNDAGDADIGPNLKQNYPSLTAATLSVSGTLTITGTLDSTPSTTIRVEYFGNSVCNPSGYGEAEYLLLSKDVTTDGSGVANINEAINGMTIEPKIITATATDPAGNTSEFSACRPVICSSIAPLGTTLIMLGPDTVGWSAPVDVTWVKGNVPDVGTYTITDSGSILADSSLSIAGDNPGPGDAMYYIVRPLICGSWQNTLGSEPARDTSLP